jgi:hypothetical protein
MSKFFHTIKVWLYRNLLTGNPDDYTGRAKMEHVYDVHDISHLAETRGGSGIAADEMSRSVNAWLKEMSYQLCDANGVNTGYFTAALHVKGVFDSASEPYSPKKHTLLFEFQQGSLLRKELDEVNVTVAGVADTLPLPETVIDCTTGVLNETLTLGGIFEIKGFNLKFIPGEEDNGVFLTEAATGTVSKVAIVPTNTQQHLMGQVPAGLPAGDYTLSVATRWSSKNGQPLKSLKTGQFPGVLLLGSPQETPAS